VDGAVQTVEGGGDGGGGEMGGDDGRGGMRGGRRGAAGWWREEVMDVAVRWGGVGAEGWGLTSRVGG
jgi:hypothetical protein